MVLFHQNVKQWYIYDNTKHNETYDNLVYLNFYQTKSNFIFVLK